MLCGPDGVLVPRPTGLDGLELEEPVELDGPEALPELAKPAVHSARLIIPSLFLSRDSKLGVLLRLAKPLFESVEPDVEPDEPIDPDEPVLAEEPDTLGVLGEVVLGEVVLPDVCANALPTARLIADRAINACFNFMSTPQRFETSYLRRMRARAAISRKNQSIAHCLWRFPDSAKCRDLAV